MKLAFSTLPCMNYTAQQLLDLCQKYNFSGVEVRTNSDNSFTHSKNLYITDIGSSVCIKNYNQDILNTALCLLKNVEENNIKAMRVFLGNFCPKFNSSSQHSFVHDEIVAMLQKMCDSTTAEVWVETHNEYSTGKVLNNSLNDVNRENLKIIWDVMHPIEDGEMPLDTLKYLGEHIAHIHIKDGKKHSDPTYHDFEYTPLGEGIVPIKEIVTLLNQNKYNGFFSLEWESLWRPELKNLSWNVDEILSKYVDFMESLL